MLKEQGKTNDSIKNKKSVTTDESRLSGYFCSKTVFNLSNRVLSDAETRTLEKGLDYAPIQRKINERELRRNSNDFAVGCTLNGTFEVNLIQLVKNLHLDLSHYGSLPKATLFWKLF